MRKSLFSFLMLDAFMAFATVAAADKDGGGAAPTINVDTTTQPTDYRFNFKTDKAGNKRDSIDAKIPVPSVAGLVDIIQKGGKDLELLLEAASNIVITQARSVLATDEYADVTTENFASKFPFDQISWAAIAAIEPKARMGGGVPSEVWDAFAEDFEAIMPAATGKKPEHMALAAKVLASKFAGKYGYDKELVRKLDKLLDVYITTTEKAEDFAEAVAYLKERAKKCIEREEINLADAL